MKVIVCGASRSQNREEVFDALDAFHAREAITLLINGGARGVDLFSSEWARSRSVPLQTYKAAHWETGTKAFFGVNEQMLAEQSPALVLAFPGGTVTDHLVSLAQRRGIAVQVMG